MSTTEVETGGANQSPYPSLTPLKEAHAELLKRHKAGVTGGLLDDVDAFIHRASASGALLDNYDERLTAQSLIDYWVTILYRAKREVPDATLDEFDENLSPKLDDSLCPYRGLSAFQELDKDVFFGRHRLVEQLVEKLAAHRFVFVVGPSGSGKSSLVLAGLIPSLKSGSLTDSDAWRYMPRMVPGANPLKNLSATLAKGFNLPAAWEQEQVPLFLQDPGHLSKTVNYNGRTPTLLVVDQFEEVFTLCTDEGVREAFINNLSALAKAPGVEHKVVVTMRTDFESFLAQSQELTSFFEATNLRVAPLTASDLRDSIEEPARKVGLKFEDGVVDSLVKDILGEPAGLPLLQFTLLRLWRTRVEGRNRITMKQYRELGGARRALSLAADEFYNNLPVAEQQTTKRILLRLARPSGNLEVTSNRVRRETLNFEESGIIERVLEQLRAAGLVHITKGDTPANDLVEVAHEALVRNWQTLIDWLDKDRVLLRQRLRLTAAAEHWLEHGRDPGGLLGGALLAEALQYDDLNELEREFVQASKDAAESAEREKEEARLRELEFERAQMRAMELRAESEARIAGRLRKFSFALVALTLVSLCAAAFAVVQTRRAFASEKKVTEQMDSVEKERARAEVQRGIAVDKAREAERQTALVKEQKEKTDRALEDVETERAKAVAEGRKAKEQTLLAERSLEEARAAQARETVERAKAEKYAKEIEALGKKEKQELSLLKLRDEADALYEREKFPVALDFYSKLLDGYREIQHREGVVNAMSGLAITSRRLREAAERKKEEGEAQGHGAIAARYYNEAADMIKEDLDAAKAAAQKSADESGLIEVIEKKVLPFYVVHDSQEKIQETHNELKAAYKRVMSAQAKALVKDDDVAQSKYESLFEGLLNLHGDAPNQPFSAELESIYRVRLENYRRVFEGPESEEIYQAAHQFGDFYRRHRMYKEAEPLYLEALKIVEDVRQAAFAQNDVPIEGLNVYLVELRTKLGDIYAGMGRTSEAESSYLKSLEVYDIALEVSETDTAWVQQYIADKEEGLPNPVFKLATLYKKQGKTADVAKTYVKAVSLFEKYPEKYLRELTNSLVGLGDIYMGQGDFPNAEKSYARAVEVIAKSNAPGSERALIKGLANLAVIKYESAKQKPGEAEKLMQEASAYYTRAMNILPEERAFADSLIRAALIAEPVTSFGKRDSSDYENFNEKVLAIKAEGVKRGDLSQAEGVEGVIQALDAIYNEQRNLDKLVSLAEKALAIRLIVNLTDSHFLYNAYWDLGWRYRNQGNFEKAAENYLEAIRIMERDVGPADAGPLVGHLTFVAVMYGERKMFEAAEPLYLRSIANLENGKQVDTQLMVDALLGYADLLKNTNRAEKAKELEQRARAIRDKIKGGKAP